VTGRPKKDTRKLIGRKIKKQRITKKEEIRLRMTKKSTKGKG